MLIQNKSLHTATLPEPTTQEHTAYSHKPQPDTRSKYLKRVANMGGQVIQVSRPSDPQTLRPADPQTLRPSDPQTLRPSDPQTRRPADLLATRAEAYDARHGHTERPGDAPGCTDCTQTQLKVQGRQTPNAVPSGLSSANNYDTSASEGRVPTPHHAPRRPCSKSTASNNEKPARTQRRIPLGSTPRERCVPRPLVHNARHQPWQNRTDPQMSHLFSPILALYILATTPTCVSPPPMPTLAIQPSSAGAKRNILN